MTRTRRTVLAVLAAATLALTGGAIAATSEASVGAVNFVCC